MCTHFFCTPGVQLGVVDHLGEVVFENGSGGDGGGGVSLGFLQRMRCVSVTVCLVGSFVCRVLLALCV